MERNLGSPLFVIALFAKRETRFPCVGNRLAEEEQVGDLLLLYPRHIGYFRECAAQAC